MSNLKRKSSEYSGSYDSRSMGSNVKVKLKAREKKSTNSFVQSMFQGLDGHCRNHSSMGNW